MKNNNDNDDNHNNKANKQNQKKPNLFFSLFQNTSYI